MTKIFLIIIVPIVANLLLLDLFASQAFMAGKEQNKVARNPHEVTSPVGSPTSTISATPTVKVLPSAAVSIAPQVINTQVSGVREYFVPFGTGINSTDDWADIPGVAAYIDSTLYTKQQDVLFEASVHIPTGNESAYVRLFNVTDQHPVWFSDVSTNGSGGNLLVSNPVKLDSGKKLYQVQMKTSLKYPAVLDQSRLHIVVY